MYRCSIHEINHSSYNCPRCEAEERHKELLDQARDSHEEELRKSEELHEEAMEALRESDYRRANPGDYECPHCRYISLKRYATRCPLCRESPDSGYWDRVEEQEAQERARAKAEQEERARLAAIAAEEQAKKAAIAAEERARQAAIHAQRRAAAADSARTTWAAIVVVIVAAVWAISILNNRTMSPNTKATTTTTTRSAAYSTRDHNGEYHATLPGEALAALQPVFSKYPGFKRYDRKDWNLPPNNDGDKDAIEEVRKNGELQAHDVAWGDFNGDGKEDYALFLVRHPGRDLSHQMRFVTILSRRNGGYKVSSPCGGWLGPGYALLNRMSRKMLLIGPLGSEATLVARWKGSQFVCD